MNKTQDQLEELRSKLAIAEFEKIKNEYIIFELRSERRRILTSYTWRSTKIFRELFRLFHNPKSRLKTYLEKLYYFALMRLDASKLREDKKKIFKDSIDTFYYSAINKLEVNENDEYIGWWDNELQTPKSQEFISDPLNTAKEDPRFKGGWNAGPNSLILQEISSAAFNTLNEKNKIFVLLERIKSYGGFTLKTSKSPVVSVIIPVYGQTVYTLTLLCAILEKIPKTSFEIIIIDDKSPNNSGVIFDQLDGISCVHNSLNIGFVKSCNVGAQIAKGQFLYFLNNDTIVLDNWLDGLHGTFLAKKDAGLVGSKLLYPDGRLQEAGGIVWKDASAWNYGRLQNPNESKFNFLKKTDYCSGASIMITKDIFFRLGLFDERYAPAYCEDTDLAFSIRKLGLEVYYQPRSQVIHFEGISNGTDLSQGIKSYQVRNQKLFRDKWANELEDGQFENGEFVFWANSRSKDSKTVLVIDSHVPKFDMDAGSRTIFQIIELLLSKGYQVKFWALNGYKEKKYTEILEDKGVEVYYGPKYGKEKNFEFWLTENGGFIDAFFISRPEVGNRLMVLIKKVTKAPIIYYGHDVHHMRMQSEIKNLNKSKASMTSAINKMTNIEKSIWHLADLVLYPSIEEVQYVNEDLKKVGLNNKAMLMPVFGYSEVNEDVSFNLEERKNIMFVGGFGHSPNVDGILWFINTIFPVILLKMPGVRLTVIGSNPPSQISQLNSSQITVAGYISDEELAEYYRDSKVVIAPLRYGAGMKGKVIEAFFWGVPLVTTTIGVQGMSDETEGLLVSDDPSEFARIVLEVLSNDVLWRQTSNLQLKIIKEKFSTDALFKSFSHMLPATNN